MSLPKSTSLSAQLRLRPRRRWLRFSLRTFLLVVTVLCIWLGVKVEQARRQKEAVAALKKLGATFYYAHQRYDAVPDTFDPSKYLVVPEWLGPAGADLFQRVVSAQALRPVSEVDLSHLAALPHIERLYFGSDSNVSDAGLAHLPRPDRLVSFGARDTLVGDGFVKRLRNARRLEALDLGWTRVTDEGLLALRNLTNLKRLDVSGTKITDAGMAALRNITALETLSLRRTQITGAGLVHLKNAKRLRHLSMSRTNLSDAGLLHLHGLPALQTVTLDNTLVTPEGIAALKAATPALGAVDEVSASQVMSAEARAEEIEKFRKLFPPQRAAQLPGLKLPAQDKADPQAP